MEKERPGLQIFWPDAPDMSPVACGPEKEQQAGERHFVTVPYERRLQSGLLLRLDFGYADEGWILLSPTLVNTGGAPCTAGDIRLGLRAALPGPGAVATAVLSGGPLQPFRLSDLGAPCDMGEGLALYDGETGFVAAPVLECRSDVQMTLSPGGDVLVCIKLDGIRLQKGESRPCQRIGWLPGPCGPALTRMARLTAEACGARVGAPLTGWCSWYDRTTHIDEADIEQTSAVLGAHRSELHADLVQIDDGYQTLNGDWSANHKFPQGLAWLAGRIRTAVPYAGIWISPLKVDPLLPWRLENEPCLQQLGGQPRYEQPNPFHPRGKYTVDPTLPKSREFLRGIVRTAVDNGYNYLKLDFNDVQPGLADRSLTRLEALRELYRLYRESAAKRPTFSRA